MQPTIHLRNAQPGDEALILRFIRGLAEYEKLAHECIATEADLTRSLFGERPEAEVILASVDAEPAGFALFFHNYSTFLARKGLYLEDLFVLPEYRGKGVGLALLRELARIAVERECGRMEWAVLNWNQPAIDFYNKLGARPMNEWTVYRLTGDSLKNLAATATSSNDASEEQGSSSGAVEKRAVHRSAPPANECRTGLIQHESSQLAVDPAHPLDLAARREALVEAFLPEVTHTLCPRRQPSLELPHAVLRRDILVGQVGGNADHGFEGDRPRDHVARVTPGIAPDALRSLQEVAHVRVVLRRAGRRGRRILGIRVVGLDPAVQLVEQLRLQDPLLLPAATAQPVDPVAQRAVALTVEHVRDAGCELAVARCPGYALVEVDEVAAVDVCWR